MDVTDFKAVLLIVGCLGVAGYSWFDESSKTSEEKRLDQIHRAFDGSTGAHLELEALVFGELE